MALKQTHDNRCRDIVGEICHNLDWLSCVLLLHKLLNVHLQDILIDHGHIVIRRQGIFQNRNQGLINLNRNDLTGTFCQILCHCSDSRSDFQYAVLLHNFCGFHNFFQNMTVNQKVLPEPFLEIKVIFFQNLNRSCRIS